MNILSGIEPGELEDAVRRTDVARISLIPGIGKKTALRIAMELQDKIEKKEKVLAAKGSKEKEDLVSALPTWASGGRRSSRPWTRSWRPSRRTPGSKSCSGNA